MLLWAAGLLMLAALPLRGLAADGEGRKVYFADPFIMWHDSLYYAYGTSAADGIEVLVSTDLEHWHVPGGGSRRLALHKDDVWGEKWFWAPEVYRVGDKFLMYYSGDEHICAAVSDSPLGPFRQTEQRPMLDEKAIDHTLFVDTDGTPYLFFVRFMPDGLNIWMSRLEDDLMRLRPGTLRPCIKTSQPWERTCPSVNEGPTVLKHKGTYYMTYSGNAYTCQDYGIGCATTASLDGEWVKYAENPLLQHNKGLTGVGHNSLFTDRDGQLRIVYHAHKSHEEVNPRFMYVGRVSFERVGQTARMRISPDYLTARFAEP